MLDPDLEHLLASVWSKNGWGEGEGLPWISHWEGGQGDEPFKLASPQNLPMPYTSKRSKYRLCKKHFFL